MCVITYKRQDFIHKLPDDQKPTISDNAVIKIDESNHKTILWNEKEKKNRFSPAITFQILVIEKKERDQKLITWVSSSRSDPSTEGEGKEAFDAIDFDDAADENLNPNQQWGFGSGSNSYSRKRKSKENTKQETLKSAKSGTFNTRRERVLPNFGCGHDENFRSQEYINRRI